MEEEVLWCGSALMVTLSVIYLEFKAHLTSMATTAFCSDTPSHLVWASSHYHLYFNRTMTQHTSRLCKGYFTTKESDGVLHQMTWPPHPPTSTQLRWFGMSWTTEWRKSSQQVLSICLLQNCWKSIPGEAGWGNAKSVQSWQRVTIWRISNIKYILICLTLFWLLHDSICVIS
jgi:hypothetical protein